MQATPEHATDLPRRIVVAVDGDAVSDHAIAMGMDLGRRFGARVDLVHAVRRSLIDSAIAVDPSRAPDESELLHLVERRIAAHVDGVLAASGLAPSGARVEAQHALLVKPGIPARVLVEHARETDAALILLGSLRPHAGVDFGSTARAVLAKAPCPVLVQPRPPAAIQRILVAFDMSDEARRALATACTWARRLDARVEVLHCFDTTPLNPGAALAGIVTVGAVEVLVQRSRAEFERALSAFDWAGVQHDATFVEGVPVTRILEAARAVDLVVMGTHGRSGFAAALIGSVAYGVLKHAPTPILVVRDPGRSFPA
jgi:nucleotide-binding universal stress UspA family protein